MSVFLVTYELVSEVNRSALVRLLHGFPSWARLSHNVYAVSGMEDPAQVYCTLSPALDLYDRVYVVAVQKPFAGIGVDHVDRWLESHLRPAV
ncbi:MAG: hypothetical protein LBE61_14920 [Burkholderiaceae bacterium]|jgi:hypothetical protein|nr:hypothetical protein [Burkholderiaceae bacterium]